MDIEERYDHRTIEAKHRKAWLQSKLDVADIASGEKPFYNLMMFPYPSAEGLHVGNMYAFTGSDIYGRFKRMQGYNVFEPIGLDGFGIHSENYALKIGHHPMDHAQKTEERYYDQLHKIGAMYDWSRTVETYDPDYYRFTQWLFVQMFKHGLAYRGKALVNWCPSDKTVLADEQVIDGRCERCGNLVEKRELEQWFFRITAYAGKLLDNIRKLDWPEKIKVAQTNWIGKKEGINITYPVTDEVGNIIGELTCFTTRPDTNFGATFVVIAPEHPFITQHLKVIKSEQAAIISRYIQAAKKKSDAERIAEGRKKTGVFTGLYCVNQLNHYKMPLYISDFVLMNVGTGAVVGVPGHDRRDFEFAQTFKLPIIRVVTGSASDTSPIIKIEQVQEEEGTLINSEFLNGLDIHEATQKIMDYLEEKDWGKRVTTYHLRDWLISRQRYWGPPIPMVFCEACAKEGKSWFTSDEAREYQGVSIKGLGKEDTNFLNTQYLSLNTSFAAGWPASNALPAATTAKLSGWRSNAGWYPVSEDQLPVILPRIPDYKPGNDGVAPLAKHKEFYETTCPGCGAKAVRETEVSDTFLDSSWYFLRYPSVGDRSGKSFFGDVRQPQSQSSNVAPSSLNEAPHMPEQPIANEKSGRGFSAPQNASPRARRAPAPQENLPWDPAITKKWLPVDMYTGGAEHSVLHLMYSRFVTMALHDWGYLDFEEPFTSFYAHGLVIKDSAKMSKSKGNVVNPDEYIAQYGADALRLYLMFMGPFSEGGDFRDTAMEGMHRWINRVWRLITAQIPNPKSQASNKSKVQNSKPEIKQALHRLIKKVTEDIEKRRYNTAIAAMMEFTNLVADKDGALGRENLKTFILLLAPFAPFLAEELWQRAHLMVDDRSSKLDLEAGRLKIENQSSIIQSQDPTSSFKRPASKDFHSVHLQPWPSFDPKQVAQESVKIIVQVNGKLRDALEVKSQRSKVKSEVEFQARASEKIRKFLLGRQVQKVIFVPGRLINFVVS